MLSSGVDCGLLVVEVDKVDAGSVTLLEFDGVWVVGVFLIVKERDSVPHSFRVKTMVRFSPAGRGVIIVSERASDRYLLVLSEIHSVSCSKHQTNNNKQTLHYQHKHLPSALQIIGAVPRHPEIQACFVILLFEKSNTSRHK